MSLHFIKPDTEVVYSTEDEEMWEDELQARIDFELRTGKKYDAIQSKDDVAEVSERVNYKNI